LIGDTIPELDMNRDMKRMMKKREKAADRLVRPPAAKRKRTKPREFLREVRGELGRVAWPTRSEVVAYTLVVLVTVSFFMAIISGLDFLFTKAVVQLIGGG
jgi:preprotein translocase subunit SecE